MSKRQSYAADSKVVMDVASDERESKTDIPYRQIRATFNPSTIRVYQAYSNQIADAAISAGRFVSPPFSMTRMTWVKPSFLWMAYRAGWGFKDDGQRRILGIDITHDGFRWALENACLSHPGDGTSHDEWRKRLDASPVRIQWDPERDIHHNPLDHRSIQIGLTGEAVQRYVNEWIVSVTDLTETAHRIKLHIDAGELNEAHSLLPAERPYLLNEELARSIEATQYRS